MRFRKRIYGTVLAEHLRRNRQMALVTGPRQVGKTTTCRRLSAAYMDWDDTDHRRAILGGHAATAEALGLDRLQERPPVAVFDELHKFARWKAFLKGFYDTYGDRARVLVTGSSRMDIYRRGGDSLMGRYFLYRMHPFSVAEVAYQELPDPREVLRRPRPIADADFNALWEHGGFPEPFVKRDARFSRRWAGLRRQQFLREDIRDLTRIQELDQLEALVAILLERSGAQIVYSNLAGEVQVAVDTLRRWVNTLCGFHLGFVLRPWFRSVRRSLRKEPKWYLRDWSGIGDAGDRGETFVACHLLKAVEGWTDLGLGEFQLGYLRDRRKREVDFVVVRDRKPWMLVEVKTSDRRVSPSLGYFQQQIGAAHAFQVVLDEEYVDADCFARPGRPLAVPARTFLSQLF
jgi:hypothetical protein